MKKVLIPILTIVVFALARPAVINPDAGREFQIKVHNVNQVEMCVSNFGKFGQREGEKAGLWWPKGSRHSYVFGAGPWFGTIDQTSGDTLVSIGYGPSGAETEFVPGDKGMSQSDPNAIIFMYPETWPPPVEGWTTAEPPQKNKSHQDSWCVINDLDKTQHNPGDTRPIGLVIYQTVYAWNLSTTQDIIFIKYELRNVSGDTLRKCYFGVCADNDIGNESPGSANDRIAGIVGRWYVVDGESLWVDNLGYQWQDTKEAGWSEFPGTIGYDYLQSPYDLKENMDKDEDGIPDQYERDSSYYVTNLPDSMWDVDLDGTPDWRDPSEIPQLGMTAFKRFTLSLEPTKDNERYVTLAGYNFKTMVYEPFVDTAPSGPDDQRFLQCSGPFDIAPDSVATILVGIILAYWHDTYSTPDTALVNIDNTCQFIYDKNWLLPGPPPPPTLTCVPGDARVTLVWDNAPEHTPDPYYDIVSIPGTPLTDTFYRQYDFEGYGVWKSLTGKTGDWSLLGRYDLFNNIVFEDTTAPESIRIYADDKGLVHSYVDEDVRNGFTYYYAVTSYDYNLVKDVDSSGQEYGRPIWFESGLSGVPVVPRREPANLVPGEYSLERIYGNELLGDSINVSIVNPLEMKDDIIQLELMPIDWSIVRIIHDTDTVVVVVPLYKGYLEDADGGHIDSIKVVGVNDSLDVPHTFPVYNGLSIGLHFVRDLLPTDKSIFEAIEVKTGSYPESLLVPSTPGAWANYWNFWPYRGNDYEVHWFSTAGSNTANSVVVIDLNAGDTINFTPYRPVSGDPLNDTLADGWSFLSLRGFSDTLVLHGSPAPQYNTKFLYICGGLVGLKRGGPLMPGDELPRSGDVWVVHANTEFSPVMANGLFRIHSVPGEFASVDTFSLHVKVVPNPYIIHNEWQQSSLRRRLRFINLPSNCTIRIFNLNGELVKVICHKASSGGGVINDLGGDEEWDLLSENHQLVASGVYVFHIQSDVGEQVGKFVVVR